MGEPFSGTPPSARPPDDRLDSWKEIAAYLNRDVTTVQRWEKREGMPIHRHLHDRIGSVYASRRELDTWARGRNLPGAQETGNEAVSSRSPSAPQSAKSNYRIRWKLVLPGAAALLALIVGVSVWLQKTEYFWRNPISDLRFQAITDFDGMEQAAAISPDGKFVAFLSNREGQMDVWLTQVGSGQFHNLTHGSAPELVNPSVRTLGFSQDGSLVTYWVRKQGGAGGDISIWAVPTLGGQPKPYLEGIAEFDWSRDGSRLVYHTPGPGDPMFVTKGGSHQADDKPIFTAPGGLHSHFPSWAPDGAFIYFVQGALPDNLDIWRIPSGGGTPERMTSQNCWVSHPVFLNKRTMMYLATDSDGSGPWLYSIDVARRIPHRLTSGPNRYTSLAASADGRRLVATLTNPKSSLWRLQISDGSKMASAAAPISLTTSSGFSPRLGENFLLYVSTTGESESIWKLADGISTELWKGEGEIFGGPAISRDGGHIAFSLRQKGQPFLYVMQTDGTNARLVSGSLKLQGDPAWSPDGQSIISAANDNGIPHLFRIPLDGRPATVFVREYSIGPAWAPNGRYVLYSGADIGTTFSVKAVTAEAAAHPLPALNLTRGARHLTFLPDGRRVVLLRGEIKHKNLWLIDLETGAEQQLTNLAPDFDIRDFDISPDGREIVLERVQDHSDVVLLDFQSNPE